uniref:Ig-like domain-containing protein n=1 Tax=Knipowitschia caucasica TaxID=637954 RepID=A0AAV2MA13_KNICA
MDDVVEEFLEEPLAVLPSSVTLDVLVVEQNSFALERSVGDPVHPVVGSLKRCDAVLQSCLELNAKVTIGSKVFVTSPIQRAGFDAKSRRLWHPGEGKLLERGGQCVVVVLFLLTLAGLRGIFRCQARMRQLETTGTGLETGARSVLVEAWMLQPTVQATLGRHGGDPKSQGQLYFGGLRIPNPLAAFAPSLALSPAATLEPIRPSLSPLSIHEDRRHHSLAPLQTRTAHKRFSDFCASITVECPRKRIVAILFQPVTVDCKYQSSSQRPVVLWKYKSYCRDPVQAALNPNSAENILAQNNPNYDPNIECADSQRTVRNVASKDGSTVTLGPEYQGRKISILNDADLNLGQTAWGDSGVYICSVTSSSDLTGNTECYTEVIVLDWLLVVLVVLGFLLLLLLIGICWCQCCPHTCCCYVSCPCCPERCCCPRALYEAGKAVKKGMAGQYAATMYAPSVYGQPAYSGMGQPAYSGMGQPAMPMLPLPNGTGAAPPNHGYGRDHDGASSVGQGSQVPLLRDQDGGDHTRSGYRIQVDPDGNATRAIYYMERELANLDPTRPGNYNRMDTMSEVSSLHDRGRAPAQYDQDEAMSTISSVSQHVHRRPDDRPLTTVALTTVALTTVALTTVALTTVALTTGDGRQGDGLSRRVGVEVGQFSLHVVNGSGGVSVRIHLNPIPAGELRTDVSPLPQKKNRIIEDRRRGVHSPSDPQGGVSTVPLILREGVHSPSDPQGGGSTVPLILREGGRGVHSPSDPQGGGPHSPSDPQGGVSTVPLILREGVHSPSDPQGGGSTVPLILREGGPQSL